MLPAAIFLLVVMAALGAFFVQVGAASQQAAALDMQGARALQAARAGIERGLYAVQIESACGGGTLANIPGLNGFRVTWACNAVAFTDGGTNRTIWQITSTACYTGDTGCPSSLTDEIRRSDYVERQLIVVTER
ncbi:MAG: hypothetical protein CGU28_16680 [Candidatus Dactylopiibacterium carminicum]|uniref:MSHA biogenesis protein MshP n=1 Tax=Candidatus Dactylopiibacterium carminicum TaxID=857335 RepID=A0A272EMP9_9RHOO|nr:hypothetical protein [Candidatus Dactylopiibacterium carminicum]KAF7597830.1 hypothetical protein BGI27_16660 [Candidatus Dactylopiibacterium carminicum]PAS91397.1 MAG: hypothetical protein CGU29_16640 [Candidatus Dactylopiibacterium carminicum]PAS92428.1 MAG: hypothetical protein CGU28_16680 [Candidatus Dactylopiibacterium carminicum]PAS95656.1 MAG: hypothetical protein BSR46_16690 [Candidatus Dactylopiibacterium carminicum]